MREQSHEGFFYVLKTKKCRPYADFSSIVSLYGLVCIVFDHLFGFHSLSWSQNLKLARLIYAYLWAAVANFPCCIMTLMSNVLKFPLLSFIYLIFFAITSTELLFF